MTNPYSRADIMAWRKAERRRLIEERLAINADQRRRCASEIMIKLSHFIGELSGRSVSVYWPFRGEPDLRRWMERLAAFRPHLCGAVWRGTATRRSSVHIDLYCDDSKAAELALIDGRVDYEVSSAQGPRGRMLDVLNVFVRSAELGGVVHVALAVLDYDDLRGALRHDARGRSQRGDLAAA